MAWVQGIFNSIAALLGRQGSARQQALRLFAQRAAGPDGATNHQAWLRDFVASLNDIKSDGALKSWLEDVECRRFALEATDAVVQNLPTALLVDTNHRVVNARKVWEAFVVDALVEHDWTIALWPQGPRWFKAALNRAWTKERTPGGIFDTHHGSTVRYIDAMARRCTWARDMLLEFRVLHVDASPTLDAMFQGAPTQSLAFVTALSGIALRMHENLPSATALELHRLAYQTWPAAMKQVENTMAAQALLDESPLATCAGMAQAMRVGSQGCCAYLMFFGTQVHGLMAHSQEGCDNALPLPALD